MHMFALQIFWSLQKNYLKKILNIFFRFINFIHTSPPGLVKYSISHMHREELVQSSDLPLKMWGFENVFCTGAASNNFVGYIFSFALFTFEAHYI